jgi:hypothetical protein
LAACTVAHTTARIGEAHSTLADGVISHANTLAVSLGAREGLACSALIPLIEANLPMATVVNQT